jgi:hypothetical protein
MTGIPRAAPWTKEEYDSIFEENSGERFGLKEKCVFNVLEAFHAVGQFPMDPMHDFLEKVGAYDAQAVIVSLAGIGKLTIENYNALLENLRLEDYESGDRPLPVNPKAEKLAGKAMSVSLHIRIMPFLLSQLLDSDYDSDLLDLLFMLSKINEYILAECFSEVDVVEFQELVVDFFEKKRLCKETFPLFKKYVPKDHFLEHYSQQILDFGPFTCTWTARCESRHRDFVNFSESSKNFINILKTLANKNQKKMASRFYSGFFSAPLYQFPGKKCTPAECGGLVSAQYFQKSDFLTSKMLVKNTLYKIGHLVVTKVESDNVLQVGKIMMFVVRHNEPHLLITRYECARTKFRYFDAHPLDVVLVKYSSIRDFKPLICRTSEECPRFVLHHHLPYLHDTSTTHDS